MDMAQSISSSSEGSFILVDTPTDRLAPSRPVLQHPWEVDSLAPYFASLQDPQHDVYSYEHIQLIKRTRAQQPDGRLFVDELLALLEMDGPSCYPCHSPTELAALLVQLLSSPYGQLKSYSIILYLCLAESSLASTDSSLPGLYMHDMLIPVGFVRAIEGFFALDSGAWRNGVGALADPHVTPEFIGKILDVLGELPPVDERAGLVINYVNLSGVVLEGAGQVSRIVDALCDKKRRLGLVKAWKMARAWEDEAEREGLFTRILRRCFGDNASGIPVPHHLQSLLSLTFTPSEDTITHAFCLSPPSSLSPLQAALAADFRISKYVAERRPLEALSFGRQVEQKGLKGSDARAKLLRAVRETLTTYQRNAADLAAELSTLSVQSAPASTINMPVEELTQPTWHPRPAPIPKAPITSLRDLVPPPPAPLAKVADLPLSASPFLRQGTMLVGSSDGSSTGGVQKSVLKALWDAKAPPPPSLDFGRMQRTTVRSFAEKKEVERKPLSSLFGNARTPAGRSVGSTVGGQQEEEEEVEMSESSPPVATPSRGFRNDQRPPTEAVELPFTERAVQDPAIAAALALASSSTPSRAPKRRTFSSQSTLVPTGIDKRRAVSTEVEDRPSAIVQAAGGRRPPGAFPAMSADEMETETEASNAEEEEEVVEVKRTQPRRSARASSVVPPSTPRAKTSRASAGTPVETPRTTAVRRSTRLTTPMVESEEEGDKPVRRRATTVRKGRKKVAEVEEED